MICFGCYKENVSGYCLSCRKKLFGGKRVSHVLPFASPESGNLNMYQEQVKRLSISGVQLKYSLRLEDKQLVLTDKEGQYLLKPIPLSLIVVPEEAPENEHLTMQIAAQVFKIRTAANALIQFADGKPGYLTKRFDIKEDGTKNLQEDFAQLSQRTKKSHGENFKYDGSYEEIGLLIKKYVAAYMPILEDYFRLVLFNYLFSNGDAHMKNFSLTQTATGEYQLTPAYDLMCTVIHTPTESDTALDLYEGDILSPHYQAYGHYGFADFMELARRTGMIEKRAERIIGDMVSKNDAVRLVTERSFLSDEVKQRYLQAYADKVRRLENPLSP